MKTKLFILLTALVAFLGVGAAEAQLQPSSEVLLPYFEVDLKNTGKTTLMAVGNALAQPVEAQIEIRTNWGIPVTTLTVKWEAHELKSFNLRDWIVQGKMPTRTLKAGEKDQLKASLTGQRSPKDNLLYSSPVAPDLAVGSVIVRTTGGRFPALWGDYLLVDSAQNVSMGDVLVNIDRSLSCPGTGLCLRHALRFLAGLGGDADTEFVIWAETSGRPLKAPYPEDLKLRGNAGIYDESGQHAQDLSIRFMPLQIVTLGSLGLNKPFGWIDLRTDVPVFIGVHYNRAKRDGAAFQAYCLKELPPPPSEDPGLEIEKRTNGQDADAAPGPSIPVGAPVTWEYVVRNTGAVALADLTVSDDQGVNVTCPKTALEPNESMTCTGHGTATACQYKNIGTVSGTAPDGSKLTAEDPSHYFGDQNAKIDVETAVNGQDADNPNGPTLPMGSPVTWTYVVTNTGDVNLTGVAVTDDRGVTVSCPKTSLRPGESMTCSASGTAAEGLYRNVGAATAKTSCGPDVQDSDPSHYFGKKDEPGIKIEKLTNGHSCDLPPGPTIPVGDPVLWEYVATNTGNVTLTDVKVTDDKGVAVTCPKTVLQPGESMTCTGSGVAVGGQYRNVGAVTGNPPCGSAVADQDASHYFGQKTEDPKPGISLKKYTNGQDADTAPGPEIPVGNAVHWTYIVTNTGGTSLSNVKVTDDRGVAVSCPKTSLQQGESMTCTGNGAATAGQYKNIGTTVGTPPSGPNVTSSDPSHYYGKTTVTGNQGCTPGYWKNHTDSWPAAGYSPAGKVQSVFSQASGYPALGPASLLNALSFNGGSSLDGAAGNLLRAAVASLLDASHPNVNYPRTPASVIADVNAALGSRDRDAILGLASRLDADNNLGCPLN
ncbi:MAG TPA: hypothetical protein VG477_00060 [Thermoanaerobaculia bacterium]|nr:hypothetical protein [Thermoanaerobaculia bacterium]